MMADVVEENYIYLVRKNGLVVAHCETKAEAIRKAYEVHGTPYEFTLDETLHVAWWKTMWKKVEVQA